MSIQVTNSQLKSMSLISLLHISINFSLFEEFRLKKFGIQQASDVGLDRAALAETLASIVSLTDVHHLPVPAPP